MSNIHENLQKILHAVWGKDVRQAIHDAIHDCYEDGSAGSTDLIAREEIEELEATKATRIELAEETADRLAEVAVERGRIDNLVTSGTGVTNATKRTETTLFSASVPCFGNVSGYSGYFDIEDAIENYDYIKIRYSAFGKTGIVECKPSDIPATGTLGSNVFHWSEIQPNYEVISIENPRSVFRHMDFYSYNISSGNTHRLSIDAVVFGWNGDATSNGKISDSFTISWDSSKSLYVASGFAGGIYSIIGVKYTDAGVDKDTELTDIRTGADGTVYQTAGGAVRGQIEDITNRLDGIESNFGDEYDSTATYAVGDRCVHEGVWYECNTAISTAEDWTEAHWDKVSFGDIIDQVAQNTSELSGLKEELEEELDADNEYVSKPLTFSVVPNEYVRSNGAISVDSDHEWSRTDKISVVGYSEIKGVNTASGFTQNAFYNSSDQMVQYFLLASGGTIEVPSTASYVVFSGPHAQVNTAHIYGKKKAYAYGVQESIENIKDGILLQSKVQQNIKNATTLPIDMYETGSLSMDGLSNDSYRASYRAKSNRLECNAVDIAIKAKTGNKYAIKTYSTDGQFIESTDWLTATTIIKAGTIYKLLLDCDTADMTLAERLECFKYATFDYAECDSKPFTFQCRDAKVSDSIPPNSVYAIRATALNQYDRVRLSVTKTADNQYVCVHDTYINNIAVNMDGTTITPNIETDSLTVEQLNQYDWGLKFGSQYKGLQVPMLSDCLVTASKYNIKVALDFKWVSSFSDDDVDAIFTLLAKTGQLDCILSPLTITTYQKFKAKSERISYYFYGTDAQVVSQTSALKLLHTSFNDIYIQPSPFGEIPSDALIKHCAENGFKLYMTQIEGIDALMSIGFDHGINLYECHYIENIKSTVKAYNDLNL